MCVSLIRKDIGVRFCVCVWVVLNVCVMWICDGVWYCIVGNVCVDGVYVGEYCVIDVGVVCVGLEI